MDNKQIHELYTRMQLNTNQVIDNDFSKSIKFAVDEYIENEVPKTYYFNTMHDAILFAYRLYLQGIFFNIGVYDRQNNYSGSDALLCWLDEPQKAKYNERDYQIQLKLERLGKLEKMVSHYKISDATINEIWDKQPIKEG